MAADRQKGKSRARAGRQRRATRQRLTSHLARTIARSAPIARHQAVARHALVPRRHGSRQKHARVTGCAAVARQHASRPARASRPGRASRQARGSRQTRARLPDVRVARHASHSPQMFGKWASCQPRSSSIMAVGTCLRSGDRRRMGAFTLRSSDVAASGTLSALSRCRCRGRATRLLVVAQPAYVRPADAGVLSAWCPRQRRRASPMRHRAAPPYRHASGVKRHTGAGNLHTSARNRHTTLTAVTSALKASREPSQTGVLPSPHTHDGTREPRAPSSALSRTSPTSANNAAYVVTQFERRYRFSPLQRYAAP